MSFSMEMVRSQVQCDVEATSLRAVAREVRMSPTGLRKLMRGTAPYGPTRRKLHNWMEKRAGIGAPAAPRADLVATAVNVLLHDIPMDVQRVILPQIAACLDRAYAGRTAAEQATSLIRDSNSTIIRDSCGCG
jgi:hypothetical protein